MITISPAQFCLLLLGWKEWQRRHSKRPGKRGKVSFRRDQLSANDPHSNGEIGWLLVVRLCLPPGPPTSYIHAILKLSEPLRCNFVLQGCLAQLPNKSSSKASPSHDPPGVANTGCSPSHDVFLSATGSGLSSLLLLFLSHSLKDVDDRVQSLQETCSRLPRDSYNNLRCFAVTGLLRPQAITRGSCSLP